MSTHPTLIIPPSATPPTSAQTVFNPPFTAAEIDLLQTVLLFYRDHFPQYSATQEDLNLFNSALSKIEHSTPVP